MSILPDFYWPEPPGVVAGYTAPLSRWVKTILAGYTSGWITLQSDYAQTYRPEHHNFKEHFIFEPQLEPGIPQSQLDELQEQDIRLFHVVHNPLAETSVVTTYGFGPTYAQADFDRDGDVDQDDFDIFQNCATGPCLGPPVPSCIATDLDDDDDVDQSDFGLLQRCFSGPNIPASPTCAD